MESQINTEHFDLLLESSNYGGEEFNSFKIPIDSMTAKTYDEERYYYYTIYAPSADGEFISAIADYEDTIVPGMPLCLYGDNEYTDVYENGTVFEIIFPWFHRIRPYSMHLSGKTL